MLRRSQLQERAPGAQLLLVAWVPNALVRVSADALPFSWAGYVPVPRQSVPCFRLVVTGIPELTARITLAVTRNAAGSARHRIGIM